MANLSDRRLLVVGAKVGSIGGTVVEQATLRGVWDDIVTAGLSGEEKLVLDVSEPEQLQEFFEEFGPFHAVVCTAGINDQGGILDPDIGGQMMDSAVINWIGHVYLLSNWLRYWFDASSSFDGRARADKVLFKHLPLHWASISSNSARIARSKSLAYCASKAALSASIRCAARDQGHEPVSIYCYEPGWVEGTPMSVEVGKRLALESGPFHRIPGGEAVHPIDLADLIVHNLSGSGKMLNGCCLRADGGEQ